MRTTPAFALIALLAAPALHADSSMKRVECRPAGQSPSRRQASVRGTMFLQREGEGGGSNGGDGFARGSLAVAFGSGAMHVIELAGRYERHDGIEVMELEALPGFPGDVMSLYLDFQDSGREANSYVDARSGIYRVTCSSSG